MSNIKVGDVVNAKYFGVCTVTEVLSNGVWAKVTDSNSGMSFFHEWDDIDK